ESLSCCKGQVKGHRYHVCVEAKLQRPRCGGRCAKSIRESEKVSGCTEWQRVRLDRARGLPLSDQRFAQASFDFARARKKWPTAGHLGPCLGGISHVIKNQIWHDENNNRKTETRRSFHGFSSSQGRRIG